LPKNLCFFPRFFFRKSFAACYGISNHLLDEVSKSLKDTDYPIVETERAWTEKTTSDKTFAEAQQVFDSNLGEQSGDGKRSIYSNVNGIL
jgi:hypothetical protein